MKNPKQATDSILEKFYEALVARDGKLLFDYHIPRSDVFYVRAAIEVDLGVRYSLDRVERAMYLEGHLDRKEVLDPDRKREWE